MRYRQPPTHTMTTEIEDMVGKYTAECNVSWDQDIESGISFSVIGITGITYTNKKGTIDVPINKIRKDVLNLLSSKMVDM